MKHTFTEGDSAMSEYSHSILIGRFQPFHKIHFQILEQALHLSEKAIIVIGSARAAPSIKNPFSYEQRIELIKSALPGNYLNRVDFIGVRDYFYNENAWVTDVQQQVTKITGGCPRIATVGSFKDASSYYLNLFPQWEHKGVDCRSTINATDIRTELFERPEHVSGWADRSSNNGWGENLPKEIIEWIKKNFINTNEFIVLQKEYEYLKDYRNKWKDSPFPPTFVTADAIVIKSGHVLVVRRRIPPGRDQIALPGGFVRQNERIRDTALRELKEETRIDVPKAVLERNITRDRVFDYPERSLRGRTITHAFCIDLGMGPLPTVKGGDDASGAFWMPLMDLGIYENSFFEDHAHMIFHFMHGQH